MDTPASIQARLEEREEIISTLCILVKIAPTLLSGVFVAAAALSVWSAATGNLDRSALTVALALLPCAALWWVTRHLVLNLLDHLDLRSPEQE
jgi:hypothetical protein